MSSYLTMRTQLERRLQALRAEYQSGQNMLADLLAKEASLRETLLRISGAIQVLEEELAAASGPLAEDSEWPDRVTVEEAAPELAAAP